MSNKHTRLSLPKGFSDRTPDEYSTELKIMNRFFEYTKYMGFSPILVSPVSFTSTFQDNREVTNNWTYRFNDKKNRDLILNPDSLPPLLRTYAGKNKQGKPPVRWSFCTPIFRYKNSNWEKRYRFHLGATLINVDNSIYYDYLIASIPVKFLVSVINVKPIIKINDFYLWRELFKGNAVDYLQVQELFYKVRSKSKREFLQLLKTYTKNTRLLEIVFSLAELGVVDTKGVFDNKLKKVLPETMHARIDYLVKYSNMIHKLPKVTLLIDLFDFHAAPFHDGIAFKVLSNTDLPRIGDGGSNHAQGHSYDTCINTVYSVALNWEAISKLYAKSHELNSAPDVYVVSETVNDELLELIEKLRMNEVSVFENLIGINFSKDLRHAVDIGSKLFLVFTEQQSDVKLKYLKDHTEKLVKLNDTVEEILSYLGK